MSMAIQIATLSAFVGSDLTRTLAHIEGSISGLSANDCPAFLSDINVAPEALAAASEIKRVAGQINVTVHALGILACLPHILEDGETVEYVSLGAGNTGRQFDLETNLRIAEFKFINWRGGPESIRQNSIFKDFFDLAEAKTEKRKYLYLLGTEHALKFFNGGRALGSVLSKNDVTKMRFEESHGAAYSTVREYFTDHRRKVSIQDVSCWLPQLST